MSGELSNIYKQQKLLLDMKGQNKELQKLNEEKDKNSLTWVPRADLEHPYEWVDSKWIGDKTVYARAVVAEEGSEPIEVDTDKFSFFSVARE